MNNPWPKISIVTPSYNQAQFVEQTVLSVLNQDYPNFEYIVIDGGSTDGSANIIRKYSDRLVYWVSEPDRGQAHAINKGFERATGEVLAWLNSDDLYLPGALGTVGRYFRSPRVQLLRGNGVNVDESGRVVGHRRGSPADLKSLLLFGGLLQPATFWRRSLMDRVGPLDETLQFCMDFDLWCRMARVTHFHMTRKELCAFRIHEGQKTHSIASVGIEEHARIVQEHLTELAGAFPECVLRVYCVLRHYLYLECYGDPFHFLKGICRCFVGRRKTVA